MKRRAGSGSGAARGAPSRRLRILLSTGILIGLALLVAITAHLNLNLEGLQHTQRALQAQVALYPWLSATTFFLAYVAVTAFSLPVAIFLTLGAGAAFGVVTGTLLVSFASTLGATLAMLASRFLFRDWIRRRGGARIQERLRRDGAFYLFSLRIVPGVPFVLVNLCAGLAPIRVTTYWWVSQLGMLPATVVLVNAGMQLGTLTSLRGLFSASLLLSLLLLAALPWVMRVVLDRLTRQRRRHDARHPHPLSTSIPEQTPP